MRLVHRSRNAACLLVLGTVLLGLGLAGGQDNPSNPATEDAPWKLLLKGKDAEREAELKARLQKLEEAGKFSEAVSAAEELLALRLRVQGRDFWQTAESRQEVAKLKQFAALPAADQAELASARKLASEARGFYRQARFADALSRLQQVLEIHKRLLGQDHLQIATDYNNAAMVHEAMNRFPEGEQLFRKSLAIFKKHEMEDHPNTATCYSNLGMNLQTQGKYEEALEFHRKALAICRRLLGEDSIDTMIKYNNLAATLGTSGRHAEAEHYNRKALEIHRRNVKEEDGDTATLYSNLAVNLDAQGKYTEAESLLRKALEIQKRVLPDRHPDIAHTCSSLASSLEHQGKYRDAEKLLRDALAIFRERLVEGHDDTIRAYGHLATNLDHQGRYVEGHFLLRQALQMVLRLWGEDHRATANVYNNLAMNIVGQGKRAEAEPLLLRAEAIYNRLGETSVNRAATQSNLGMNYSDQEKYEEAERWLLKALAMYRQVVGENHPQTAEAYNNLGGVQELQGKYAAAESYYEKALKIRLDRLGPQHLAVAESYNNLSAVRKAQGQLVEGERLSRQALDIRRLLLGEHHHLTGQSYKNLGLALYVQGKYDEAESEWVRAVENYRSARLHISFAGLDRAAFAAERSPLPFLAAVLARNGKPAPAWDHLEENLARGLFDDLSTGQLRPLSAEERQRQQMLAAKLHEIDKRSSTLAGEKGLTPERKATIDELDKQRHAVQTELAQFEFEVNAKYGVAAGEVYDRKRIQGSLPAAAALIAWLDMPGRPKALDPSGEHWACLLRSTGESVWVRLPGSGAEGTWTKDDERLPARVRQAFRSRAVNPQADWRALSHQLYLQRLAPLEGYLRGGELPPVRQLIVVSAGKMGGIPLEAIPGMASYTISYAPSATMFAWLQEGQQKRQTEARKPAPLKLLALGNPHFAPSAPGGGPAVEPPDHGLFLVKVVPDGNAATGGLRPGDILLSYAGTKLTTRADLAGKMREAKAEGGKDAISVRLWREGWPLDLTVRAGALGVEVSPRPAAQVVRALRDGEALLRGADGEELAPLPGTAREVETISGLFPDPITLLGPEASEQRLEEMANRLRDYAVLHFATHGLLNNERPMQSALILAQQAASDPKTQPPAGKRVANGRLTAEQILRTWKLDAELVTLSACQTGLGKQSSGEGYLGFSQALFLAGARSLVLSLWKVDDEATSLLMARFYRNLLRGQRDAGGPLAKAWALHEAKQWLRNLTEAEVQQLRVEGPGAVRGAEGPLHLAEDPKATESPYAHPYYWAGFILVGDPGDLPAAVAAPETASAPARGPGLYWIVLGSIAVLLLGSFVFYAVRRYRSRRLPRP